MVTAPGSGAEIIPFLKTWVNLPAAIGFTILYAKASYARPCWLPLRPCLKPRLMPSCCCPAVTLFSMMTLSVRSLHKPLPNWELEV